ncbi:MAG: hypothetical protein COV47_02590 [Candidatus Diapherotrites archaeon CG11_big_fil_rev_8_21_14_0_20_37_9]|nr:MAG: hypothetical protein COV47_02590 [Candidatus Diapherotrites archaeon CG11_big_fil_rev_8_21_14_0_20_37_9]
MGKNFSDKDVVDAGRFIFITAVLFLLFNFFVSLIPLELFEFFYATASFEILKIFGHTGYVIFGKPVLVYLDAFTVPLGFTYLCTGILEMVLVWSAVLASHGIEIKKRIIGICTGTIALVAFNVFRIVASVQALYWFGLDAGNFSHDLFFRIFLFVTVAGFYYVWFRWATGTKTPSNKR